MEIRNLGASGLKISAIAYGNWLTHGSQVEEDAALSCVRQALDEGITTFDTADVYANTAAESVLGKALAGERREGLEIFTKVFWPTGPGAHNDKGLGRKHILESIDGSLRRLGTDYVDLYQAHRYDHGTPLEETMVAFADVVRAGKALYIGVSEWRAEEIRAAAELARELRVPLVSNQPQYSLLWRVIEPEVVPTCRELGIGQIVWSPIAQGVLTGKYLPGQAPPTGSRATDDKGGADMISRWLEDDVLERVQQLRPIADGVGLSLAQLAVAWVLQNDNVSAAIIGASRPEQVTENVKAAGVELDAATLSAIDDVVSQGAGRHLGPGTDEVAEALAVDLRKLLADLDLGLGHPHELHLQRADDGVVGRALERLVGEAADELLAEPEPQHHHVDDHEEERRHHDHVARLLQRRVAGVAEDHGDDEQRDQQLDDAEPAVDVVADEPPQRTAVAGEEVLLVTGLHALADRPAALGLHLARTGGHLLAGARRAGACLRERLSLLALGRGAALASGLGLDDLDVGLGLRTAEQAHCPRFSTVLVSLGGSCRAGRASAEARPAPPARSAGRPRSG